jgi:hypothetical protein
MIDDGSGPPGARPLFEAILDEQRTRWDRGERPPIEDFLARHATLRGDTEPAIDVIYQEFVIRRARGETPSPVDYLRRFPGLVHALMRQFAVDDVLQPLGGTTEGKIKEPSAIGGPIATTAGSTSATPARSIDGYAILDELGRGGTGIVFKALDPRRRNSRGSWPRPY